MQNIFKNTSRYQTFKDTIKSSFFFDFYKKTLANIATSLNENPSKDLFVIGVTGTNGKTTTSNIIYQILNKLVAPSFLYSSSKIMIGNHNIKIGDGDHIDVFELNTMLSTAKQKGCRIAILEVSPELAEKGIFDYIQFDAAVLTNTSPDHVDYNNSFSHHIKWIKYLFYSVIRNKKNNKFAVFPKDDNVGRKWFNEMPFDRKVSFSIDSNSVLMASDIETSLDKTTCNISYLGQKHNLNTKLLSKLNIYNILTALGICCEMGVDIKDAINIVNQIEPIPNRLDRITHEHVHYFLDITHSPLALRGVLSYLNSIKQNRLIVAFGAPGTKDIKNRNMLGTVVSNYGDIIIATDNEPNTENRLQILSDITQNIKKKEGDNFFIIPERAFAFQFATYIARPDDIVLFICSTHNNIQYTNTGIKKRNDRSYLLSLLYQESNS